MPFCPVCKLEYAESAEKCYACGVDLVAKPPPEGGNARNEELAPVFSTQNAMEAEIVKSLLEAEGISVWNRSEAIKRLYVENIGALSEETLFVLESRADEARAVIEQALEAGKHDLHEEE